MPSHCRPLRSALSLARCGAAGLEDLTLCAELLLKNNQSQPTRILCFFFFSPPILCTLTALQDLSTAGWLPLNLQVFFFLPLQHEEKFVIVNVIALAHLSNPPDSMTQLVWDNEALAVVSILASGAFSHFLGILH